MSSTPTRAHHLSDVLLVNARGERQRAGARAFLAAATQWQEGWEAQLPADAAVRMWPITGARFVLVAKAHATDSTHAVLKFLREGGQAAGALDSAPLPPAIADSVRTCWP